MKALTIIILCLFILGIAGGVFFYLKEFKPLKADYLSVQLKNEDLERNIDNLNQELNQKVAEITKSKKEKEAKEAEIARIQTAKDSLIHQMQEEIDDNQIQITQLADKLKVSILDKILFPSGEADITDEGLLVLERVGNILKTVEDKIIRVEGHTDNVPIHPRLQKKYPSNWELSTARATTVVRFLQETVGMDAGRLEAVGLGENQPIASNDTREERAQNRRIEIALLPLR